MPAVQPIPKHPVVEPKKTTSALAGAVANVAAIAAAAKISLIRTKSLQP
jgi:hypothetical protein